MTSKKDLYQDAQKRIVAVMLADDEDQNRIFELITSQNFLEPKYQVIFESITSVARVNQPITPVTVAADLETKGLLQEAGGVAELYSLRTNGAKWLLEAPSELYAMVVREYAAKAFMRMALKESNELLAPDSGRSASEVISELQDEFNGALYSLSDESTVYQMAGSMDDYFKLLEERRLIAASNAGEAAGLQGIPSLIPSLNQYTTGWLPGQLITVGARTGVGKSIFAVNCAMAAAKAGKSVLFFSLEMGEAEIKDRMIASTTGITLNALKQGALTEEETRLLQEAKDDLNSMKIQLDIDPKVTVDAIRARALRKAQSAEGLDFIIVDYLQLITPSGKHSSRQEAVADISRNMKLLAKQLQMPIMVLVQVNRADKEDENGLPRMDRIRESGAIAQDSDIVILLHREESMDDTIPHTLILLEKNRNGEASKTIRCHSNLECSLFRETQKAKDIDGKITDADISDLEASYADDDDLNFGEDDDTIDF
jgi:replicative DNA helicase